MDQNHAGEHDQQFFTQTGELHATSAAVITAKKGQNKYQKKS